MNAKLERFLLGCAAPNPYGDNCEVLTKDNKTPLALSIIDDLVSRGLLEPDTIYVATIAGRAALASGQSTREKSDG